MSRKFFETYPHLEGIDGFSVKAAKILFSIFPQWEGYAIAEAFNSQTYLAIKVPAPVRPTDHDLAINTAGDRITVYFDWYHAHFYENERNSLRDACYQAKEFVDLILDDKVIVVYKFKGGNWTTVMWIRPDMFDTLPLDKVTYTRSWRGTYDRNYEGGSESTASMKNSD